LDLPQLFFRAFSHLKYFLSAIDDHSIQAPIAFQFYNDVFKHHMGNEAFETVGQIREYYTKSRTTFAYSTDGKSSSLSTQNKGKVKAIARWGSSPRQQTKLLCSLAFLLEKGTILELGTSLGIGTCSLALPNPSNHVYSFESNLDVVQIAKGTFEKWGVKNVEIVVGNIDDTLPAFLEDMPDPIDIVYIDANHTYGATVRYFELLWPRIKPDGAIIIDDIRWSKDMWKAWAFITSKSDMALSFDYGKCGLIVKKETNRRQHYIIE